VTRALLSICDVTVTPSAFLEDSHRECAACIASWAREQLMGRPETLDDGLARQDARALAGELGEAGWLGAIERQDLRSLSLIRESVAMASPLADAVIALQALGGTPIVLAGSESQRARWLPGIVAGRILTGYAMTEPEAGTDAASLRTTAHRDGSGWVIDGEKHLISNAGIADVYVVFAATSPGGGSRGISAFLVSSDAPGLRFAGAQAMAALHPLGRLRFERCRVQGDALLGELDRGFRLGMATLDRLRPTVGAAACGMAARALGEAVRHAATRRQFGQLLGDLQLIREKLGRMATELAASRLLVYHAAWLKDRGAQRISTEAAMAKSYATETAQRIVDEAVQILGGSGVLLGNPVERLYRAVRALRIYEGATEIQRLIIGGALVKEQLDA
jgi:acyl-CoA dehydrogenase